MNILVVEDDAEMAQLLVRGLREEAHEVDLAYDGGSALRLSNSGSFDIVLLDVMLPGIDGLEVAKQLRLRSEQVPVLMLTARDSLPEIVKGLDAGADKWMRTTFGDQRTSPTRRVVDAKKLLTEQLTFEDSRDCLGLQRAVSEANKINIVRNRIIAIPTRLGDEATHGDRRCDWRRVDALHLPERESR